MADGSVLHVSCIQIVEEKVALAVDKLHKEQTQLKGLQSRLQSQQGMLAKLVSLLTRRAVDILDLQKATLDSSQKIERYAIHHTSLLQRLTGFYDLYLDYPPDWELRRTAVINRDGRCRKCRSYRASHVHHIIPLGRGGTNRIDNLLLLCRECHLRSHGVSEFPDEGENQENAFSRRVILINQAIRDSERD